MGPEEKSGVNKNEKHLDLLLSSYSYMMLSTAFHEYVGMLKRGSHVCFI